MCNYPNIIVHRVYSKKVSKALDWVWKIGNKPQSSVWVNNVNDTDNFFSYSEFRINSSLPDSTWHRLKSRRRLASRHFQQEKRIQSITYAI